MDIKTVRLLADYNAKTNSEMNGVISRLDEAQWNHNFSTFFPSIFKICNHIYIADFNWLKRFSNLRAFEYINNELLQHDMSFTADAFKTTADYLSKREYLDGLITEFTQEITETDLERDLKYVDIRGVEHSRSFSGLVLHMFNHQTHNRAMISIFLEMLGIENDYSNLARLV